MNAPLHWLSSPEWSHVVKTLLHSLWQGALVAAALALVMRRVTNPRWRYRFSLFALVMIPISGTLTWAAVKSSNHPLPAPAVQPIAAEAIPTAVPSKNPQTTSVMVLNRSSVPMPLPWTAWLALVWIIGAGAMLGRAGIKVAGAERLRRSCQPLMNPEVAQLLAEARRVVGLTRKIRVAVTDKLTSPAVVGVLVPTLVLPLSLVTALTPEQLRFILLHELAHIRRGDYFANLFQLFVEAGLFFNPAVWWISHHVRREREACCDALAIELSGAPADYARTLVHVAESILYPATTAATAFGDQREPSSLADRVQRLLVPGYRPSLRLTWRAMITAFLVGATLLVLSAEGTRMAVAQITRPAGRAINEKEIQPHGDQSKTEVTQQSSKSHSESPDGQLAGNILIGSDWLAREIQLNRQWIWHRTDRTDLFRNVEFNLSPQPARPAPVRTPILTSGNSAVTINSNNSSGMESWTVDGQNQLYQQWFWYRVGSSVEVESDTAGLVGHSGTEPLGQTVWFWHPVEKPSAAGSVASARIESLEQSINQRSRLSHPSPQPNPPPTLQISGLSENSRVEYDANTRNSTVVNGGVIRFNETTIRADSIQLNQKTGNLVASENVRIERPGRTYYVNKVELNIYSNSPNARGPLESTNITYTSERRRAIANKLGQIQLERVAFDGLPLTSVVRILVEEAKNRDPEGRGVNIIINPTAPSPDVASVTDIGDIRITINPPLMNVRLADVLDAISKAAERPLKLSIEDYAVVISLKGQEPPPLFMREFNLDSAIFLQRLTERGFRPEDLGNGTNNNSVASATRSFLAQMGVDLNPAKGKSVFYHDRRGILLVRATMKELDVIETAVIALNRPVPQINIKAQFMEIPSALMDSLSQNLIGTNLASTHGWTAILSKAQTEEFSDRLKAVDVASLLSQGEVTTLSGRQAQLQFVDLKTIVTGINPLALAPPGVTSTNDDISAAFQTQLVPLGPVIDIIATAGPDEDTVQLTAMPSITEFLGYESSNLGPVYVNGRERSAPLPLPRLRTRNATHNAIVWDGQTVVLGNPQETIMVKRADGTFATNETTSTETNILIVLVTPTIIDPAGNPKRLPAPR